MSQTRKLNMPEKEMSVTSELLTDVYVAIVKGTRFISNISEEEFSDFIDVCQRIKTVQYLFNRKMNRFLEQNMIEPLLVDETENIDDFFRRQKTRVDQYLDYVKTFVQGKIPEPRLKHLLKKDGIFTYCPSCGHEYTCFIMFADEFLPFFKLDNFEQDTIIALKIREQYSQVKKDIERILDYYYVSDDKNSLFGWPYSLDPRNKKYDAYCSAYVMDFILTNKIETAEIKSSSQEFISKIAESIIESQTQRDGDDVGLEGISRAESGSWKNIYWEKEVAQIDVTVDILKMLSKHSGHYTEEVQERLKKAKLAAITFIEGCFEEKIDFYSCEYAASPAGWHPFAMDFPPHEDWFQVHITDITGTIAGLQAFLMGNEYNSRSTKVVDIVKWLLSVQLKAGAWPVLSSVCLREAEACEASGYCFIEDKDRDPIKLSDGKPSLSNTARAVKALNEWLDDLFSSREPTAKTEPEIQKFETTIRDFISETMGIVFGDNWWEAIPDDIKDNVEKRLQKDIKDGRQQSRRIDYLFILDYYTIMCLGERYTRAFKAYFPDTGAVKYAIEEINSLRSKWAHNHPLPGNYEEARNFNISKIMSYVKKNRINNQWRKELADLVVKFVGKGEESSGKPVIDQVAQLLALRTDLKRAQRFDEADNIRKELERLHIKVAERSKSESVWEMMP